MYPPRFRAILSALSPQRQRGHGRGRGRLSATSSRFSTSPSRSALTDKDDRDNDNRDADVDTDADRNNRDNRDNRDTDTDGDADRDTGRDPAISQGHVTNPSQRHPQDPQSQAVRAGFEAREGPPGTSTPFDAAAPGKGVGAGAGAWARAHGGSGSGSGWGWGFEPRRGALGNWEGFGFAEQVGSESASAGAGWDVGDGTLERKEGREGEMEDGREEGEGRGEEEEARAPGVIPSLKQALGMGTNVGEVKQNRGGGQGVTGTGTVPPSSGSSSRELHTAAVPGREGDNVHEVPRWPREDTPGDRNEHGSLHEVGREGSEAEKRR